MANLLRPGDNLGLPLPDIGASANLATSKFTLKDFVGHMVPKSFAEAMANNEILQIVVFSMFFGVALAALGDRGKVLIAAIDQLSHVMLKITGYVMKLAPLAVMAAMAATVAVNGLSVLLKFAVFMGDFYVSLFLLWALLVCAGLVFLGPRVFKLLVLIKEAFMLSFATASSEAAYPKILDAPRPLRREAQDLELRDADGLFVQPRRLDDVLHVRVAVHRAGVQHAPVARHADHDAAGPDAHVEGMAGVRAHRSS
ncbi:putative sodium:dicarboxylate symporter family protein [Burkholderia cenocepacia]|nr:putative sodium:dicarboxylate symporter family protein [Burkholderia cenocepacia]